MPIMPLFRVTPDRRDLAVIASLKVTNPAYTASAGDRPASLSQALPGYRQRRRGQRRGSRRPAGTIHPVHPTISAHPHPYPHRIAPTMTTVLVGAFVFRGCFRRPECVRVDPALH